MNLILLPGNSAHNREWINEVEQTFMPRFEKTYTQYYDHWFSSESSSQEVLDLNVEADKLAAHAEKMAPYIVFAKSAGVLVALKSIYEGTLHPDVCVFVGTPISWATQQGFVIDEWLMHYDLPTLFIQHAGDPAASAEELSSYLYALDVQQYDVHALPGSSHDYPEIAELLSLTERFVDLDEL